MSLSFRNQRQQNDQIKAECEEANKDAEELADLFRTKDEIIKKLESKLAEASKKIADLKAWKRTPAAWPTHFDWLTVPEAPCETVAIAELKIVESREHNLVICDLPGESVKELEAICRRHLRRYVPMMNNMRREGKLLPLKFDE